MSIGHMLVFVKKSVETFKKHVVSNSLAGSSPKPQNLNLFLNLVRCSSPYFGGHIQECPNLTSWQRQVCQPGYMVYLWKWFPVTGIESEGKSNTSPLKAGNFESMNFPFPKGGIW